jgi:tetratricopeptide (TPR) repeat protein
MDPKIKQALSDVEQQFRSGQQKQAITTCQKLMRRYAKAVEPCLLLAQLQDALGNKKAMYAAFDNACKRAPKSDELLGMYGDACMKLKDFPKAMQLYKKAQTLSPTQITWKMRLAAAMQEMPEMLSQAIQLHRQILTSHENDPVTQYNLGAALKQKKEFDEALSFYKKAVQLSPKDLELRYSLANLLFELEYFEEAVEELQKVIDGGADERVNLMCLEQLSYALRRINRPEESLNAAQKLINIKGETAGNISLLASAKICNRNYSSAMELCDRGLSMSPKNRRLLSDKTIALSGQGNTEDARQLFSLDYFLKATNVKLPDGYDSITSFNRDILNHIEQHPVLSFAGLSHSCHDGATSDEVFTEPLGPLQHLLNIIGQHVEEYRAGLENISINNHPWLSGLPGQSELNISGWVTKLNSQGYQQGHIHPTAWISGVYYLRLPFDSDEGENDGAIEFGRAPFYYPDGDQGEIKVINPSEGTLVLFPSYYYHRTLPFSSDQQRVTLAFDFRTKDFS